MTYPKGCVFPSPVWGVRLGSGFGVRLGGGVRLGSKGQIGSGGGSDWGRRAGDARGVRSGETPDPIGIIMFLQHEHKLHGYSRAQQGNIDD